MSALDECPIERWPAALSLSERTKLLRDASTLAGFSGIKSADSAQPTQTDEIVKILREGVPPPWAFTARFEEPVGRAPRPFNLARSLSIGPRAQLMQFLMRVTAAGGALSEVRVANSLYAALVEEIEILIFRTLTLEERIAGLEGDSISAAETLNDSLRRTEGRRKLFETYPGLLRQLHLRTDRWLIACAEMIDRLQADRQALKHAFGIEPMDSLVSATMAHGDAHIGGRRVILLRFKSGARLVYKPRPVEAARRFQELIAFLNRAGLDPALRTIKVLPRSGYGWVEHVPNRSCRNESGINRYFRRAGALIAALQVAGASDCHFENVMADGEHPIVIDLETLMRPQVRSVANATDLAILAIDDSLLAIGMLPSIDGTDLGALAVLPDQTTQLTTIGLIDAGTPTARVERMPWRLGDVPSLPLRKGERVDAINYADDIENGFIEAYELIVKHREMLLGFVDKA